jgi:hypothetical protein
VFGRGAEQRERREYGAQAGAHHGWKRREALDFEEGRPVMKLRQRSARFPALRRIPVDSRCRDGAQRTRLVVAKLLMRTALPDSRRLAASSTCKGRWRSGSARRRRSGGWLATGRGAEASPCRR